MGILNVTPDSFVDGGMYLAIDDALRRVDQMVGEGVDVLDVGGESTRPRGATYGAGSTPVDVQTELRRVIPVIRAVASRHPDLPISIDTYKSEVAESAVEAGATIINDVTGLRFDPRIGEVAHDGSAALILMHSVGLPGEMPHQHAYGDLMTTVVDSLSEAVSVAKQAGVEDIVLDPGFGFGKSAHDNLALISRLRELGALLRPVLVGISRKSTIGRVLSDSEQTVPVEGRLFGSLAAAAVAIANGASIVRCHDVGATRDVARTVDAIMSAGVHHEEVTS